MIHMLIWMRKIFAMLYCTLPRCWSPLNDLTPVASDPDCCLWLPVLDRVFGTAIAGLSTLHQGLALDSHDHPVGCCCCCWVLLSIAVASDITHRYKQELVRCSRQRGMITLAIFLVDAEHEGSFFPSKGKFYHVKKRTDPKE